MPHSPAAMSRWTFLTSKPVVSAWNLTRITRPLELRNQFGVGLPRLPVLHLCDALSFSKVRIDFFLVCKVKCESPVHLLEGQGRIALYHTLCRHPLAEEVNQGIEGYASVRDRVCAVAVVYVFLRHQTRGHTPTSRRATPLVRAELSTTFSRLLPVKRPLEGKTRAKYRESR